MVVLGPLELKFALNGETCGCPVKKTRTEHPLILELEAEVFQVQLCYAPLRLYDNTPEVHDFLSKDGDRDEDDLLLTPVVLPKRPQYWGRLFFWIGCYRHYGGTALL